MKNIGICFVLSWLATHDVLADQRNYWPSSAEACDVYSSSDESDDATDETFSNVDEHVPVLRIPERVWSPVPEIPTSPRGPLTELMVSIILGSECNSSIAETSYASRSRRSANNTAQLIFFARFEEDESPLYADIMTITMSPDEILTDVHSRIRGAQSNMNPKRPVTLFLEVEIARSRGSIPLRTIHRNYTPEDFETYEQTHLR